MIPDWNKAWALVAGSQRILIACHLRPDGDAIGSLLGLGHYLMERGKTVDMVVDGGQPAGFKFLQGADQIRNTPNSGKWDLFISVDTSDEARTGSSGVYGRANSAKILNIDHHVTNLNFGDVQLVLTSAVSTTEIIYRWLQATDAEISTPVAQSLLTGLVTDTQGFRTDNVGASSLAIAQELMNCGADLGLIIRNTLNQRSYHSMLLWQRVLPRVELEGSVISATIQLADWQSLGVTPEDDGGLVTVLRQVREAKIAVVFFEIKSKEIKIELRCDFGCDVSAVALALGGGGHQQASGATLHCDLSEAKARVLPLLHKAAEQGQLG